jgi:hypothetical protein
MGATYCRSDEPRAMTVATLALTAEASPLVPWAGTIGRVVSVGRWLPAGGATVVTLSLAMN